jgi:hypothetical protein
MAHTDILVEFVRLVYDEHDPSLQKYTRKNWMVNMKKFHHLIAYDCFIFLYIFLCSYFSCLSLSLSNDIDYSFLNNFSIRAQEDFKNLKKFSEFIEIKLNESIELFEFINEEQIDSSSLSVKNSDACNDKKHVNAINFLHTLFAWYVYYMVKSAQPIKIEILRFTLKVR